MPYLCMLHKWQVWDGPRGCLYAWLGARMPLGVWLGYEMSRLVFVHFEKADTASSGVRWSIGGVQMGFDQGAQIESQVEAKRVFGVEGVEMGNLFDALETVGE